MVLHDFLEYLDLSLRVIQCQQCPCMSHVYLLVLQSHLDRSRQFQQAQVVGYGRALLAHSLAQTFLGQFILLQQMLVGQSIQVLTLDVFYECHLHHILIVSRADISRNGGQSGHLRCTETPLSGYDLIGIFIHLAQRDRLDDADFGNGIGKLLQGFRIEVVPGLVRIY